MYSVEGIRLQYRAYYTVISNTHCIHYNAAYHNHGHHSSHRRRRRRRRRSSRDLRRPPGRPPANRGYDGAAKRWPRRPVPACDTIIRVCRTFRPRARIINNDETTNTLSPPPAKAPSVCHNVIVRSHQSYQVRFGIIWNVRFRFFSTWQTLRVCLKTIFLSVKNRVSNFYDSTLWSWLPRKR